jgi:hypothetical protein
MTKLLKSGSSVYKGMLAGVSVERPRNMVASWQGASPSLLVIIRPSLATCSLSSFWLSRP